MEQAPAPLKDDRAARLRYALALAALLLAGLAALHWRAFDAADRWLLDQEFQLLRERAPRPLAQDVVLVGVDEETFRVLREPFALWHPHLGRFMDGLARARPAVLGLDIVLPDRSYHFLIPRWDQPLLEGLAGLRKAGVPVVLAQALDEHGNQRKLFAPFLSVLGPDALGSVAMCRDPDQVIRRFGAAGCGELETQPSLAARMAHHMKVDQDWHGLINYTLGEPVDYIPFQDVLTWIESGDEARLAAAFAGRPVLLGVVLPYTDRHALPVALARFEPDNRSLPGVLVHVQALRSMLGQGFVLPLSEGLVLALGVLAMATWFGRGGWLKAALLPLAALAFLAGSLRLLWMGHYVPGASLALLALAGGVARAAWDALEQGRERRFLRAAFGAYVSPPVLRAIVAGRIRPGLGGAREHVCVMFCDIRGFTRRAEAMAPEEVIRLLNDYFAGVTAAIYRHGGTTNKFLGDGLLAFFGAPQPLPNPEKSALEAAQDILVSIEALNRRLAAAGVEPIQAGVGLHAGEVLLGHVGGASHQEYTAIGDVVNLASRLESLTKEAGYPVLCSAAVADAVGRAGGLADLGERPIRGHAAVHVFGWLPPLLDEPPVAGQPAPDPA